MTSNFNRRQFIRNGIGTVAAVALNGLRLTLIKVENTARKL